jgi:hypothetical protein
VALVAEKTPAIPILLAHPVVRPATALSRRTGLITALLDLLIPVVVAAAAMPVRRARQMAETVAYPAAAVVVEAVPPTARLREMVVRVHAVRFGS